MNRSRAWFDTFLHRVSLDDCVQLGDLRPDLLFPDDGKLARRLARHPGLLWKAENAKDHRQGRG